MSRTRMVHAAAFALAALIAPHARAQQPLTVSTQAGFAMARFTGDIQQPGDKSGLAIGIAVQVPIAKGLAVQPELAYVSKGNSYGTEVDPVVDGYTYYGTYQTLYALDYLEMPVLLRLTLPTGVVRPVLVGGGYAGFKMTEKFRVNGPGHDDYEEKTEYGRAFDFGYAAGAGLEIGSPENGLTLDVRWSASLASMEKPEYDEDIRNRDLRFQLGWKKTWPNVFDR